MLVQEIKTAFDTLDQSTVTSASFNKIKLRMQKNQGLKGKESKEIWDNFFTLYSEDYGYMQYLKESEQYVESLKAITPDFIGRFADNMEKINSPEKKLKADAIFRLLLRTV